MVFAMTTKRVLNCFVVLITCCSSACAQIGESCIVRITGLQGVCKIVSHCPAVEEQGQNGITPTICGYYQLAIPIVCCEISPFVEANDDTLLSREPPRSESTHPDNRQPSAGSRGPDAGGPQPRPGNPDALVFPSDESAAAQQISKSEQKCQEYSKAVTGVVQAIPLVTNTEAISINFVKCDYNGVALIVGGKPASAGEFPFMAAVGFYVGNAVEWRCGGTLVSEQYVLTAAHCTFTRDGDSPKVVRLGDLDLSRDDDGSAHVDYNIDSILVHPGYKYPLKYNDLALLRLSAVVKFTKFIRPACLYSKPHIEQSQAIATGWGKTDYAAAEISDKLMKVSLNIYGNERCSQIYQVQKHLPQGITSNMICAGELRGGMDTCQGDSGGPLLVTKKGNHCKFYIIGITSFGKSCGQANTPAVYTKVSDFVPWIEKTIW